MSSPEGVQKVPKTATEEHLMRQVGYLLDKCVDLEKRVVLMEKIMPVKAPAENVKPIVGSHGKAYHRDGDQWFMGTIDSEWGRDKEDDAYSFRMDVGPGIIVREGTDWDDEGVLILPF